MPDQFARRVSARKLERRLPTKSKRLLDAAKCPKPPAPRPIWLKRVGVRRCCLPLEWEISIWIEDPWLLRPHGAAVREALFHSLHDHGIRMAFPQMELHLDAPVVGAHAQPAAGVA